VLDPTRLQAPVWRENFGERVGKRLVRCAGDGVHGFKLECRTKGDFCPSCSQ
jgi:hypothetical protein